METGYIGIVFDLLPPCLIQQTQAPDRHVTAQVPDRHLKSGACQVPGLSQAFQVPEVRCLSRAWPVTCLSGACIDTWQPRHLPGACQVPECQAPDRQLTVPAPDWRLTSGGFQVPGRRRCLPGAPVDRRLYCGERGLGLNFQFISVACQCELSPRAISNSGPTALTQKWHGPCLGRSTDEN